MEPAAGGFPVLMVDDDAQFLLSAGVALRTAGISPVATIEDSRQVIPFLEGREAAAVVIDLTMPHLSGQELLQKLKERYPELPVVVMTGRNEVEIAVECMRIGAFDYLVKPVEPARFVSCIRRAQEVRTLRAEVHSLKEHFLSGQLRNASAFGEIVTQSPKMLAAFQYVEVVAPSRHPVLVTGETGTGKELGRPRHPRSSAAAGGAGARERGGPGRRDVLRHPLRAPEGGVHRRRPGAGGSHRPGRGRYALPGRDRGPERDVPGEAAPPHRGPEILPPRLRRPEESDARDRLRHPPPGRGPLPKAGFRRDLYYRLSGHKVHLHPCGSGRRTSLSWWTRSSPRRRRRTGSGSPRRPRSCTPSFPPTTFPGTSGNCG